eukprot:1566072-Prymnesium_polylepis.2
MGSHRAMKTTAGNAAATTAAAASPHPCASNASSAAKIPNMPMSDDGNAICIVRAAAATRRSVARKPASASARWSHAVASDGGRGDKGRGEGSSLSWSSAMASASSQEAMVNRRRQHGPAQGRAQARRIHVPYSQ